MANNWHNFLSTCGATFDQQQAVTFTANKTSVDHDGIFSHGLYLTDLSYLGIIEVSGDDRSSFLQGQLTNDISLVDREHTQLSGLCTPKGRLKALFSIFSDNNKIILQLPGSLLEQTLKRLKMFVMMSKVELNNSSDSIVRIGIYGHQAEQVLQLNGFSIPEENNSCSHYNGLQLIRLPAEQPRFECLGDSQKIKQLWQKLDDNKAHYLNTSQWQLLDIMAGIPNVYLSSSEAFIPQMLNLQVLNGISFKKGCYTGQEIVARMHYLGKLKRRMYQANCQAASLPLPGDALFSAEQTSGQGTGHVVDAQFTANGDIQLLAVISNDAAEKNDVYIDETLTHKLTLSALPYESELAS